MEPWASPWLRGPLQIVAIPYSMIIRARNRLYDWGWMRQAALPCRVVSVGNLTVGGTGKTPVVIWLADYLLTRGFRVGVLSRGYRRQSQSPQLLVSDGRSLLVRPEEAGDEPYLIAARCPRAVVAVGADRSRLGRWVLEQYSLDFILLDDGFQHRAVRRDVDLLLVDASDPAGLSALFPAGRLREPLSSVSRASAVLLTRVDNDGDVDAVRALLRIAGGGRMDPILIRFGVQDYVQVGTDLVKSQEEVHGRRALIFSGIGNTASFRRVLTGQGVAIEDELVFPDHHVYAKADMDRVRARGRHSHVDLFLTTEKDAVKIAPFVVQEDRIWAVRLETDIVHGRERLEELLTMNAKR